MALSYRDPQPDPFNPRRTTNAADLRAAREQRERTELHDNVMKLGQGNSSEPPPEPNVVSIREAE